MGPLTMRTVTLVCGPPCSGKTTYVAQHAQPGDTVVDFDHIAVELGSDVDWMHDPDIAHDAELETLARIDDIAADQSPTLTAWIIRSAADHDARAHLAAHLDAHVVVLDPGQDECLRRAARDARPSGTRRAINTWYWAASRSAAQPR